MAITSQVWNGKAFVNTDSDTVDQKNVNDGAPTAGTLWTSVKVSNELAKKAEREHTHLVSQINGLHAIATTGNYESLINKPAPYVHPSDASTRHVTDAEKATWNGKANANHTHNYAPTSHTHTIANVTGLQAEIDKLKQSMTNLTPTQASSNWKLTCNFTPNYDQDMQANVFSHAYMGLIYLKPGDTIRLYISGGTMNSGRGSGVSITFSNHFYKTLPLETVGAKVSGNAPNSLFTGILSNFGEGTVTNEAQTKDIMIQNIQPGYYSVYASGRSYYGSSSTAFELKVGYDE